MLALTTPAAQIHHGCWPYLDTDWLLTPHLMPWWLQRMAISKAVQCRKAAAVADL
jgi:hypothetical protein